MKIYLSASWKAAASVRTLAKSLKSQNHTITSTWHDIKKEDQDFRDEVQNRIVAQRDLDEVQEAKMLVLMTDIPSTFGGMWVELGWALHIRELVPAKSFTIVVIGRHVGIFTHLADLQFRSMIQFTEFMNKSNTDRGGF